MTVRYYSSVAPPTTLSSSITNANTTIVVGSTTGFPALTPYTLSLDYETAVEELVEVTAVGGTTLTVTRGIDGTSATSHNAGAVIRHVTSARDFSDSRTHENSANGIHGLDPSEDIVGTDSVQTLTNKTLTSPVINGTIAGNPLFSGTWTGNAVPAAKIRLLNQTDVSLSSTDHAFQVGPDSGVNIRMDGNEILGVNNGATSTLALQSDGGTMNVFVNQAVDSTTDLMVVRGSVETNLVSVGRTSATAGAYQCKADADTQQRLVVLANGSINWGSGTAVQDVNLYRSAADILKTDDQFQAATLNVAGASTLGSVSATSLTVSGTSTLTGTVTANSIVATSGIQYKPTQLGTETTTFASATSNTNAVLFPIPFTGAGVPFVTTNINSGDGTTSRWISRAISISNFGFTMFVHAADGNPDAWSGIDVQWMATK
jgi:hypothetical protein